MQLTSLLWLCLLHDASAHAADLSTGSVYFKMRLHMQLNSLLWLCVLHDASAHAADLSTGSVYYTMRLHVHLCGLPMGSAVCIMYLRHGRDDKARVACILALLRLFEPVRPHAHAPAPADA